jgi:hypothetical protein
MDSLNDSNNGAEIAPAHTRLNRFNVSKLSDSDGVYNLDISMAYGDDDLLGAPDSKGNRLCNSSTGSQFCATSLLSTTVTRRLN